MNEITKVTITASAIIKAVRMVQIGMTKAAIFIGKLMVLEFVHAELEDIELEHSEGATTIIITASVVVAFVAT